MRPGHEGRPLGNCKSPLDVQPAVRKPCGLFYGAEMTHAGTMAAGDIDMIQRIFNQAERLQ
jgi:hypothetical protein